MQQLDHKVTNISVFLLNTQKNPEQIQKFDILNAQ